MHAKFVKKDRRGEMNGLEESPDREHKRAWWGWWAWRAGEDS